MMDSLPTMKLTVGILAAATLAAQILPLGQVVERVTVRDHPLQSYALYAPSNYSPERAWPILYCLDPGGRGRVPVERFAQAAEKAGFLVAGSNNSRNGPLGPSQEAIGLMLADAHERFSIDDSRWYAAGLSGGSRLALAWAVGQNGRIAGVIACSAAFGTPSLPKQIPFRIFAATGFDDFNHDEMYHMSRELAKRNLAHRYVEFEGGHEWLPAWLAAQALDFFLGRVPPEAAQVSKDAEKQAAEFDRLLARIESAGGGEKRSLVKQAQKDAAQFEDSGQRRVARRVMGGLGIGSGETTRAMMAERRYNEAARSAETGVLVRPENAGAWYSLAVAQAGAGNTKRALEALEEAAEKGFRNWERMEQEPLLAKVRREARYQNVLRKVRQ